MVAFDCGSGPTTPRASVDGRPDRSGAGCLAHGNEEFALATGLHGREQAKREEMQGKSVKWRVTVNRSKIKAMRGGGVKDLLIAVERAKAHIRTRVKLGRESSIRSTLSRICCSSQPRAAVRPDRPRARTADLG